MNSITPAEIIQWQNTIQEKGYSDDYENNPESVNGTVQSCTEYLQSEKENPCNKVKTMGK